MLEYWLWLAHRPNLNDHQKLQLVQSFQTPQGVYQAESGDFDAFPTITGQGKIALAEKDLSPYQKVLEYCQREQIRILTIFDPAYPRRLFNIYDPPPVLYYKGTLPQFDGVPVVSVVGTRRSTAYGQATAMRLGLEISQCGGMVVSGLAAGIDAAAMTGALQSGRPTVAYWEPVWMWYFPEKTRRFSGRWRSAAPITITDLENRTITLKDAKNTGV